MRAVDELSGSFAVFKSQFRFVEVKYAQGIPTAEEMLAAGIDERFVAPFRENPQDQEAFDQLAVRYGTDDQEEAGFRP